MVSKNLFIVLSLLCTKVIFAQTLDLKILKSINKNEMPYWDKTMKGISFSIYPVMPVSVLGIWTQGCINQDKVMMRNGYKSAVTIAFALATTTALKYAVNRQRPFIKYPNDIIKRDHVGPYSFPSGHTTAAFATATALSLSYKKWYVTVPSFAYASLVGYSRMRLGVHYGSDVLGGILVGIGSGLLTWQIDKILTR